MNNELKQNLIRIIEENDLSTFRALAHDRETCIALLEESNSVEHCFLHEAVGRGRLEILKIVLKNHPDLIKHVDKYNHTPLLWAAVHGHEDIVDYLASLGADLTLPTNYPGNQDDGKSPIYWAAERGHSKVVRCLINHGVDAEKHLDKIPYDLIHIAAMNGHIDVIKVLLDLAKNPHLIHQTDQYNQTPLLWAAAQGHEDIVDYLASLGADLTLPTNSPGHENDGKTPLDCALARGHHGVAANLILKIFPERNEDSILPLIKTGALALELMIREPMMIDILLKNERIAALIHREKNCNITGKSIKWYKRRPSWFVEINRETSSAHVYKPDGKKFNGSHGIVRSFIEAKSHQKIAVKSLKEDRVNLSFFMRRNEERDLKREAEFNKRAYPNDNLSELFQFDYAQDGKKLYNNRAVSRYREGETAALFFKKTTCEHDLAKVVLRIAQELQRIHHPDVGIIHGDIKENNIMVWQINNEFIIYLIDFGLSSYLTEEKPTIFSSENKGTYIAPEVCDERNKTRRPHPSIDVYSFGHMLKSVFLHHPSALKLMTFFPSIHNFMSASQANDPENRPSLQSFCEKLTEELDAQVNNELSLSARCVLS